MLSRLLAAVAVCAAFVATARAADEADVRYQLTPVMAHGKLRAVAIELRFKGEADGKTSLMLPNAWGGESDLWKAITDLTISGADSVVQPRSNPAQRDLTHKPSADLVVSYEVIQDVPGAPAADRGNRYRPVVQPGYFHLIGNAVFVVPHLTKRETASFAVRGLPRGWRFASDLEHKRVLSFDELVESVLVGGDFRVVSRPGPGGFLRLALRGTWKFSDDEMADKVARIVASHNAFWRDAEEPFLVTLIPQTYSQGTRSLGGTGRGDAFAFFATDNNDDATINRMLAHEHIHTWIPARVGRMPAAEADEPRDYWLSEGLTDFYANRLLVRDGMWSVEDFAGALNEMLAEYWNSPLRTAPNAKIVSDFWRDGNAQKLPYQRGNLLALIWDKRLREASRGARDFDDVVLDMKGRARAGGDAPAYAVDNFAAAMTAAGLDVAADRARFVDKGDTIVLPADIFGACGAVATLDLAEFTRGFDPEKTSANGNVVTGTDPDGPAYAAGMRDGMKILERKSGKPGDSRVELVYRVNDHGSERIIRYMPEGKKRTTLQELQLAPDMDAATRAACAARMGGT